MGVRETGRAGASARLTFKIVIPPVVYLERGSGTWRTNDARMFMASGTFEQPESEAPGGNLPSTIIGAGRVKSGRSPPPALTSVLATPGTDARSEPAPDAHAGRVLCMP